MKDAHSMMTAQAVVGAGTYTSTQTGAAVDKVGYESVEFILAIGVGGITFNGTNKIEFVMEDSDDNSAWAAVETADVLGVDSVTSGIVKALTAAHAAAGVYRVGYKGDKRYSRIRPVFSGTHGTGTPIAITALKINGHDNPQADQI
jgi:hypothetical protein